MMNDQRKKEREERREIAEKYTPFLTDPLFQMTSYTILY
jgi:hypothetical protein